jgi:hypothetical protein
VETDATATGVYWTEEWDKLKTDKQFTQYLQQLKEDQKTETQD